MYGCVPCYKCSVVKGLKKVSTPETRVTDVFFPVIENSLFSHTILPDYRVLSSYSQALPTPMCPFMFLIYGVSNSNVSSI